MKSILSSVLMGSILVLSSCGLDTGYEVKSDRVEYTYWNAGMGLAQARL
jgi:hypothetical protein